MWWPVLAVGAFLVGSIPFSVWLSRLFLGVDLRRIGDGNPGATNVLRAGGPYLALPTLLLDVSKAAAPVGLAYFNYGLRGLPMVAVAVAPLVGHAFSPFLGFRGGKGIATALGMWIGLTLWRASSVGVVAVLIGTALLAQAGWAVMLAEAAILTALLLWWPEPCLLLALAAQALVLCYTHRAELRHRPRLRPWLSRLLLRGER